MARQTTIQATDPRSVIVRFTPTDARALRTLLKSLEDMGDALCGTVPNRSFTALFLLQDQLKAGIKASRSVGPTAAKPKRQTRGSMIREMDANDAAYRTAVDQAQATRAAASKQVRPVGRISPMRAVR